MIDLEVEPFDVFAKEPLPEPEWLIRDIFEKNSQVVVWGVSGDGKSFVTLDFAMSIATGRPWLGKYPVMQGPVLYAVGEGPRGMRRRARAWAKFHGVEHIKDMYFMSTAPRIRDPKVLKDFLVAIKRIGPVLIILDTMARSFTGDENKAEDVSDWLKAADTIQRETGACVLIVHHTAKSVKKGSKPTERGSGALRGAIDTSIFVRRGEGTISLECAKQKDGKEFEPIVVTTEEVELRPAVGDKPAMTSLVILPGEEILPLALHDGMKLAVELLRDEGKPLTKTEWFEVFSVFAKEKKLKPVSRATFFRWPAKLIEAGQICEDEGKFSTMRLVKPTAA